MEYILKINVESEDRIDKYIGKHSRISRSDAKKLIEAKTIYVNDVLVRKPNFVVTPGKIIYITEIIQKEINAEPEEMELNIVYEDKYLVVINKASGVVVHPAPGHHSGTLVNGLLHHFKDLSNINGKVRPGIVHRIDKDTSGLLIVAKDNETHRLLAAELKKHNIRRNYLAWVEGRVANQTTHLDLPIGRDSRNRKKMAVTDENSKHAKTHVYIKKILDDKTLVECELETGRTHQIRVHLAYINHPIIGDPMYGSGKTNFGQHLHAYKLSFIHPITKKQMEFKVEPTKEFNEF